MAEATADMRAALDELTADLRKKVIVGALKDAAKPIVAAAKATTAFKDQTGLVRRNLATFSSKIYKGQNGTIGVYVTVRKNKGVRVKGTKLRIKVKGQDPFYFKFLELGTKNMRKHDFLKPAAEKEFDHSIAIIKDRIAARIALANKRKP